MKTLRKVSILALMALLVGGATLSRATDIYNNSTNDLGVRFAFTNGLGGSVSRQLGDEIVLAGTERFLTNFSFEYYLEGPTLATGRVSRVTFQLNDGTPFNTYDTPGTTFYDSGWFSIGAMATPRSTVSFEAGVDFPLNGLFMPLTSTNFTFTVQFGNLDPDDNIGLDIYNPPVVGGAYNDFWEFNGTWSLQTNNAVPVNFGAVFQATVPEPTAIVLLLLGGLGWFTALRRSQKE